MALNDAQRAAVSAGDGPALVLAGAGSGKTTVIIERLVWLVGERGVDARHLLALTFTNKAAAEMRERLAKRLDVDRVASWLGTFHSFGLFILRREMERLDRPRQFIVFDDGDQLSLMKRLVKDLPKQYEPVSPRDALTWISRLKQRVEAPDPKQTPADSIEQTQRVLWERYHEHLKRASALDFDDLLSLTVTLLRDHPDIRARYQHRYQYVHIDEYQDTNRAQYLIARYLSEAHGNLFAVGDEDQGIYSWRGADIKNILDFAKDFPQAKTFRLEQNYRSTKPILDAANALVKNNINRLGKNLWTEVKTGDPVRFYWADDGEDEADFVVKDLLERKLEPKQVAVLYRTNGQSRLMEESMRRKGVNYLVVGGIKFYSRKEVKDILAYLRLLVNPDDDESLRRVLNVPPRGIGGVSFDRVEEYATLRKCPLLQVLREIETDETLSGRARQSAMDFVRLIDDLALEAKQGKVAKVVEMLLQRIDYRGYVEKSDEKDFRARIEIVEEFVNGCEQHDKSSGAPLLDFLQDLALMTDVDELQEGAPSVTLMTCHSAKGLEFDHVYLIGLEEGLLPYFFEDEWSADLEEERRLCYVAVTRARKSLTLTAARSRMLYGKRRDDRERSRFIEEIGTDRLQRIHRGLTASEKQAPQAPAPAVEAAQIKTGTRVRHAKFGSGVVMYTSGSGDRLRVRVRFDTGRTAELLVKMAPLEIVEGKHR
jgi:DNA helicase-2/ATP-dependent DNA helicase PcrA